MASKDEDDEKVLISLFLDPILKMVDDFVHFSVVCIIIEDVHVIGSIVCYLILLQDTFHHHAVIPTPILACFLIYQVGHCLYEFTISEHDALVKFRLTKEDSNFVIGYKCHLADLLM